MRKININGGASESLNYGIASNIAYSDNFTVIGRNTQDPARWKRYKGGTAGKILIDEQVIDEINLGPRYTISKIFQDHSFFTGNKHEKFIKNEHGKLLAKIFQDMSNLKHNFKYTNEFDWCNEKIILFNYNYN
mgnify:CR=1 FL=1